MVRMFKFLHSSLKTCDVFFQHLSSGLNLAICIFTVFRPVTPNTLTTRWSDAITPLVGSGRVRKFQLI